MSALASKKKKMAAVSFDEKVLAAKTIICDIEGTTSSISFVKVSFELPVGWGQDF